jgi:tryptophan synthase beta chain
MQAGFMLSKIEGIIPAIETAHALAYLEKLKAKPDEVVVICLSGRGDKDLATYINWQGKYA